MISREYIEEWRKFVPWKSLSMIEQDLIISRALSEMYNIEIITKNLAFRGGTALNKIILKEPIRYSEDIDLVRLKSGPIGEEIDSIRKSLDKWLGKPIRKISHNSVKLIYKYNSIENILQKLKIEINTEEQLCVKGLKYYDFKVQSPWHEGEAKITSFSINELMATKLRALFQRKKGRDLFDLWYVLESKLMDITELIQIFHKYLEYNHHFITGTDFINNLENKKTDINFRLDIEALLPKSTKWNFEEAYKKVKEEIITKLPNQLITTF